VVSYLLGSACIARKRTDVTDRPSTRPDWRQSDAPRPVVDDAKTVPLPSDDQSRAESELQRWAREQRDGTLPAWASHVSTPPAPETEVKVAKVNAWAERLRAKSAQSKARIAEAQQDPSTRKANEPSYWSTDALFAESKRIEEDHQTRPSSDSHRGELLSILGLGAEASANDAQQAFKKLVKEHHPDRWMHADPVLRERHADRMRQVNSAWQALRPYLAT
jgi:hypothetical protein